MDRNIRRKRAKPKTGGWSVSFDVCREGVPWDDGSGKWRPMACGEVLGTPFMRKRDCELAVAILNRECPVDGRDFPIAKLAEWKPPIDESPTSGARRYLLENCCQW